MKLHEPQLRSTRLMRSRTSNLRRLLPRHLDRTKYAYDGLGRRISKTVGADTFDYYYNEQYQVVEVGTNGDTDPYEQYVYDQRYIDAPAMVYRDTNTDGLGIQSVYVTQDANFNVTAIINGENATVTNRFVYTPYGARTVLTATWTVGTTDFARGHQGLWLDTETGAYDSRTRIYGPTLGTFYQRDFAGYVDGTSLYQYEGAQVLTVVDPAGTQIRTAVMPPGGSNNWGYPTFGGGYWGNPGWGLGNGDPSKPYPGLLDPPMEPGGGSPGTGSGPLWPKIWCKTCGPWIRDPKQFNKGSRVTHYQGDSSPFPVIGSKTGTPCTCYGWLRYEYWTRWCTWTILGHTSSGWDNGKNYKGFPDTTGTWGPPMHTSDGEVVYHCQCPDPPGIDDPLPPPS